MLRAPRPRESRAKIRKFIDLEMFGHELDMFQYESWNIPIFTGIVASCKAGVDKFKLSEKLNLN